MGNQNQATQWQMHFYSLLCSRSRLKLRMVRQSTMLTILNQFQNGSSSTCYSCLLANSGCYMLYCSSYFCFCWLRVRQRWFSQAVAMQKQMPVVQVSRLLPDCKIQAQKQPLLIPSFQIIFYEYYQWFLSSMVFLRYLIRLLKLYFFMQEVMMDALVCPTKPPIIPPTKAPRNGMGISACPIIMPATAEPTEPTAVMEVLPICLNFFLLLVALLLRVWQKVQVSPPAMTKQLKIGTQARMQVMEPPMTVLLERSFRKSLAVWYLLMSARHRPTLPPRLANCPICIPKGIDAQAALSFASSASLCFMTLQKLETESFMSNIFQVFCVALALVTIILLPSPIFMISFSASSKDYSFYSYSLFLLLGASMTASSPSLLSILLNVSSCQAKL